MRILLAALMAMHGIAHFVGVAAYWGASSEALTAKQVGGASRPLTGNPTTTGLLWAICAAGFIWTAVLPTRDANSWVASTAVLTTASALLCASEWPEARLGIAANAVILFLALYVNARS